MKIKYRKKHEKRKGLVIEISSHNDCALMDFASVTQVFPTPFGLRPIGPGGENAISAEEGVNYPIDYHSHVNILFIPGGGLVMRDGLLTGTMYHHGKKPPLHFPVEVV